MVAAIVILFCLVAVLAAVAGLACINVNRAHERIYTLERRIAASINAVTNEVTRSYSHIADGLWLRASDQVDQVIDKARARGRDSGQA
jgi:hypothetical protein